MRRREFIRHLGSGVAGWLTVHVQQAEDSLHWHMVGTAKFEARIKEFRLVEPHR
jgi:hypothetical protein